MTIIVMPDEIQDNLEILNIDISDFLKHTDRKNLIKSEFRKFSQVCHPDKEATLCQNYLKTYILPTDTTIATDISDLIMDVNSLTGTTTQSSEQNDLFVRFNTASQELTTNAHLDDISVPDLSSCLERFIPHSLSGLSTYDIYEIAKAMGC